jgi:hypothetical protein
MNQLACHPATRLRSELLSQILLNDYRHASASMRRGAGRSEIRYGSAGEAANPLSGEPVFTHCLAASSAAAMALTTDDARPLRDRCP